MPDHPVTPSPGHPVAEGVSSNEKGPFCSTENHQTYQLKAGTKLQLWGLRAHRLKQLTARLLIISNGKVETAAESTYTWKKWEEQDPVASGQLILLLQDGKAFGAKGKLLPQLALDVQQSPGHSMVGKQSATMLTGDLHPSLALWGEKAEWLPKDGFVFCQLYAPAGKKIPSASLSPELGSLVAASKNGGTVIAANLAWQPQ